MEIIDELTKAKGMKKVEFSAKVWPETNLKDVYIRRNMILGKASTTGHPQGILNSDALGIVEILDKGRTCLFLRAKNLAKRRLEAETEQQYG